MHFCIQQFDASSFTAWSFSFNLRAKAAYIKCEFEQEGVLREAIKSENGYDDIILISILSHEWFK